MRALPFLAVLLFAAGCQGPEKPIGGASSAPDPLEAEFKAAPRAGEFLMNTKNTLRGLGLEDGNALMEQLVANGSVEVRVADVQPDPADASFKSAGRLLIEISSNAADRAKLFAFLEKVDLKGRTDSGQDYAEMAVPNSVSR